MKRNHNHLIAALAAASSVLTVAQEPDFLKSQDDRGTLTTAKQPRRETAGTREKIDARLAAMADSAEPVRVIIIYRHQPQAAIVDRIESLAAPRRELLRAQLGRAAGNRQAEDNAAAVLDADVIEARISARREIEAAIGAMQSLQAARLEAAGAVQVRRYWMRNMIAAEIPASAIAMLQDDPDVAEVLLAGEHRVSADKFTNANIDPNVGVMGLASWWNAGFRGNGQQVVVLDTGINAAHPIFAGKQIVAKAFLDSARRNRCFADDPDSPNDNVGHGSHVAGIIAGAGDSLLPVFQGTAPGVSRLFALKVGARLSGRNGCGDNALFDDDIFAGIQWALENTSARIFNMSFGGDTAADDSSIARVIDFVSDTFGITAVVAAGNSGTDGVGDTALAYNAIVVANLDTRGTLAKSDDRIAASSSRGPTSGGRFKPDVAAPGTQILSAAGSGSSLVRLTGTSMATPKIAGAVAVLHQAGIKDPAAVKALLINSADQIGWKSDRGWGFVNMDNANGPRSVLTGTVAPGGFALFRGRNTGDLYATLAWNRHITDGTSNFHDLDLSTFDTAGNAIASSESSEQNVEQIATTSDGDVIIKVKAFDTTFGGGIEREAFALAVAQSGFVAAAGPMLDVKCTPSATSVARGSNFNMTCSLANQGDIAGNNTQVELRVGGVSGAQSVDAGLLDAGETRTGTFRMTAPSQPGTMEVIFSATTSTAGEAMSATTRVQIAVR